MLYGCCVRLVLACLASYSGFIATAFAAAVPRRLLGAPEGKRSGEKAWLRGYNNFRVSSHGSSVAVYGY